MSQNDFVVVTVDFSNFGQGESQNETSALIRPFRLLLDEGKPIGRINYLFFRSNIAHVLGSLCYTPGKRILFFPGLIVRKPIWHIKRKILKPVNLTEDFIIDHLTLEPNFDSFHVTMLTAKKVKRVFAHYKTKKITDGLFYWFGLSLHSEKSLEDCPAKMTFQFSSPSHDSKRRTDIIDHSRKDAVFRIIELNPDAEFVQGTFLHFDFFVDVRKENSNRRLRHMTTAPNTSPMLKRTELIPKSVSVRSHDVSIPGFRGFVWVVASVRNGELTKEAFIGIK
ncbi:hypothetical protein ACFLQ6_09565 [Thermoproteota archaeon]